MHTCGQYTTGDVLVCFVWCCAGRVCRFLGVACCWCLCDSGFLKGVWYICFVEIQGFCVLWSGILSFLCWTGKYAEGIQEGVECVGYCSVYSLSFAWYIGTMPVETLAAAEGVAERLFTHIVNPLIFLMAFVAVFVFIATGIKLLKNIDSVERKDLFARLGWGVVGIFIIVSVWTIIVYVERLVG